MNGLAWRQVHGVGWLAYAGYLVVGDWLYSAHPLQSNWLSLSQFSLRFGEFYSCYRFVFPLLVRSKFSVSAGLRALVMVAGIMLCYIGLRYGIEEVLYPRLLGFGNYNPNTSFTYYFSDNLYFASPAIMVSWLVWTVRQAIQKERENQQLRDQKKQAEEAFLRTQLTPHFLFNTLNYLYAMAYPVSRPLASAILKLSDLMRYTLAANASGQVALHQEITYLYNYLDLHELRFPGKFFVDFRLHGKPANQQIASLLLIPFVENAIKHGVIDQASDPVQIRLTIQPTHLLFEVRNKIGRHQKDTTSGIGLLNVGRRLELLYPATHELAIRQTGTHFEASLQLPIH